MAFKTFADLIFLSASCCCEPVRDKKNSPPNPLSSDRLNVTVFGFLQSAIFVFIKLCIEKRGLCSITFFCEIVYIYEHRFS